MGSKFEGQPDSPLALKEYKGPQHRLDAVIAV